MTESIDFKGTFKRGEELEELYTITTPSGKEWQVKDQWLIEDGKMVQNISITNKIENVDTNKKENIDINDGNIGINDENIGINENVDKNQNVGTNENENVDLNKIFDTIEIENVDLNKIFGTIQIKNAESYYVDLKVSINKSPKNILRSVRMLSSNIWFKITEDEYITCLGLSCTEVADTQVPLTFAYTCKVILAPIFQFMNVQILPKELKKMKKRTKKDFLDGLKGLSNNMAKMFSNDTLNHSDVVLRCGYKELIAHRNILSARSELFRRIFCTDTISDEPTEEGIRVFNVNVNDDNSSNVRQKPDCDKFFIAELANIEPEELENFIHFLYTGKCRIENYQKAKYLFEVSRTYGVDDLERKCLLMLKSEDSSDAQFEIYHFALRHQQEMLKRHVMDRVASEIIKLRMDLERKKKWMTIFERYQKPFFEHVTKKTEHFMPIGFYNPNDQRQDQRYPNEVGNEVRNNVIHEVPNNDINPLILRAIQNVTSHGDGNAGYYLYGTAYFDTRDAPKVIDDGNCEDINGSGVWDGTKNVHDNGGRVFNDANDGDLNEVGMSNTDSDPYETASGRSDFNIRRNAPKVLNKGNNEAIKGIDVSSGAENVCVNGVRVINDVNDGDANEIDISDSDSNTCETNNEIDEAQVIQYILDDIQRIINL